MKRLTLAAFSLFVGCPIGAPSLDLAGTRRFAVDGEARLTATATNADGTPATGTVAFSTTLGNLSAAAVELTDGTAKTTLSCPRMTLGCVPGASIEVTARWTSSKGDLSANLTLQLSAPVQPVDAGELDAGPADAGADGGADAGVFDAGLLLDGTPLGGIDGLVLGRLGSPRTLGFSPLTSNTDVRVGFDRLPTKGVLFADRLIYVRGGTAYLWAEDEVDAGDPDAGPVDAGLTDAGADGGLDAGPNTGPFPLFAPEANDPLFETCHGAFGAPDGGVVRALLVTPSGNLWIGCSDFPNDTDVLYRVGSTLLFPTVSGEAVAALDDTLFIAHPDGGRFIATTSRTERIFLEPKRWAEKAIRAVPGGFEQLAYDPLLTQCVLVTVDGRSGATRVVLLDGFTLGDSSCLEGQFYGSRDLLLISHTDGGPTDGVEAVPFTRRVSVPADAGAGDGGTDAGSPYEGFFPGPPSNFLARPPELSVDFSAPVMVLTKP